ncbi:MAG: hypothetical protein Q8S31_09500 [Alphaproteobacteria bacterium]|nr:hypothetical protein [Alphaproteobacteria bacterium]
MKKSIFLAFTMLNFFDFQANATIKYKHEEINEMEKSPFNVFLKQNKDIAHSENLSLEEKIEILNIFFASIEISEEDKNFLTTAMLDSNFSLSSNLKIINEFEIKKQPHHVLSHRFMYRNRDSTNNYCINPTKYRQ